MRDDLAKHQARVAEKVAAHLGSDEPLVAVTAVEQTGRNKGGDLFTKIARVGSNALKNKKAKELADAAGFPFATRMVLVATDRRLLVFAQSAGSRVADSDNFAMPAELLGTVPYDHLYAAQGCNAQPIGSGKRAGWVAFRISDGQLYQLASWATTAEWFGSRLDGVLSAKR